MLPTQKHPQYRTSRNAAGRVSVFYMEVISMRKFTAALLTALLILCATGPQAGAVELPGEITGISEDFGEGGFTINNELRIESKYIEDLAYLGTLQPGTEIYLRLRDKDFEWENDKRMLLTPKVVEQFRIEVEREIHEGNNELHSVSIAYRDGKAGILIKFEDSFFAVEPADFDIDVRVLVDGLEYENGSFKVKGAVANREVPVTVLSKTVKLGTGRFARSQHADLPDLVFDLGAGVSLRSGLECMVGVYGAASAQALESDKPILEKYPQIKTVVHLETIGLTGPVSFDTAVYGVKYIYDDRLTYLGTTETPVRFDRIFYLSDEILA